MPLYEYKCQQCGKRWEKIKKISESAQEFPCPNCGLVKNHRTVSQSAFSPLSNENLSFEYRMEKGLEKARVERQEHEKVFGTYADRMGEKAKFGSMRTIPMDNIEFIGADKEFIDEFASSQTEEAKSRSLIYNDFDQYTDEQSEMDGFTKIDI